MDSKEPPLGGSRGTDPMDVVVWFGGAAAHGWSQRILTLNGVQHRGGEDPHSKNSAAAHSLVNRYYQLGHDTTTQERQQQQQANEGGQLQRSLSAASFRRPATGSDHHWLPMPKVRSKLSDTLSDARRYRTLSGIPSDVRCTSIDVADDIHDDAQRIDGQNSATRRAVSPLSMSGGGSSSGGAASFSWGGHHNAHIGVHDSLTLDLFRQAETQQHIADGNDVATTGGGGAPKKRGKHRTLSSAGSGRPPSAFRRPTSAASVSISEASSAATAKPSLAAQRGGRVQTSIDDFPTASKCRNLDATIALTRAAAVIDRIDQAAAAKEATERQREGLEQTPPGQQQQHASSMLSNDETHADSTALGANMSPTTTVAMLKKTLGSSIMHTIHKTNAQHVMMLQAKGLEDDCSAAAHHVPHAVRAAAERKMYQHIPRDEIERLKLRRSLEHMQTDFARREIEADMDAFKHRTVQNKRRGGTGGTGPTRGGSGASAGAPTLASGGQSATLTPAMLQRLLQAQSETKRKGATLSGRQRPTTSSRQAPDYGSHIYQTRSGGSAGGAAHAGMQIPVQSKISIGGHTFVYSELFRPVEESKRHHRKKGQ